MDTHALALTSIIYGVSRSLAYDLLQYTKTTCHMLCNGIALRAEQIT